jgi:hypothetical protein
MKTKRQAKSLDEAAKQQNNKTTKHNQRGKSAMPKAWKELQHARKLTEKL